MEAQEPSEKEAKRRRANWGDGGIAFFALRAEIAGELDRKVPMSRIYAKHRLRLGISYRQFIRLVRESASRPGARQPPRLCLCRKSRRHERASPDGKSGAALRQPNLRPANYKGLVPLCFPRRKVPATSITTLRMPTASSSTKGRPARQAGAKQRGTSSRPRVSTELAIM